jgi:hypothetical protein
LFNYFSDKDTGEETWDESENATLIMGIRGLWEAAKREEKGQNNGRQRKVKLKLFLCLTKHRTMKTCGQ